ncbi:hypothetical protein EDB85DRAFT_1885551 [Lactarius pseudohatsudake]|nr:hypothetical protein EDB85DRAFT_1885551 [Lactarius pseudohatsudake]
MAAMGSLATYDSIIPEEGGQWEKLDNHVVADLHRRFWGVSMRDEETKWRATQPENESMDVDETAEEDEGEGDETGAGCYILTLGTPDLECQKLWIRKDYIRLYDFCQKYMESRREGQQAPSLVITGQTGIGKSYWIYYAMRRRLAEKKPVIWYRDSTLFLFVEEGVYQTPEHFRSTTLKTLVWTLVDSDESPSGVPSRLAVRGTKHFITFTTYPQPDRWQHMEKSTDYSDKRIDEMYDQFGPTPRICFDLLHNKHRLAQYKTRYNDALKGLSLETLCSWVSDTRKFSMDTVSETIFLLKRVPKKELRQANLDDSDDMDLVYSSLEPLSLGIKVVLQNLLWYEPRSEQLRLYKHLADLEGTRYITGLVFRALGHSKLQSTTRLELVPMVKRGSGPSGGSGKLPRWHSDHGSGANPSSVRQIDFAAVDLDLYSSRPCQIKDGVYYSPIARNQEAFDSFLMADQKLYIFQFTIGSDHLIKKGILSLFSLESLPPRANWHFVFVVPPGLEISCPQPRDSDLKELLDEMKLFSMVLNPSTEE